MPDYKIDLSRDRDEESFYLSLFLFFLFSSLPLQHSLPFSEAPLSCPLIPTAQSRACRKCHCHPENLSARCTQEGMVGHHYDIKITHLRTRLSQVQINNQESALFLWIILVSLVFSAPLSLPKLYHKTEARNLPAVELPLTLPPTRAEDPGRVCFCSSWQRLMSLYHPKWQA